jgi:altronate hydrolase
MKHSILKVHEKDNVIIALNNLKKNMHIVYDGDELVLSEDIPAKHKFTTTDLRPGDEVYMYGVLVGKARHHISRGSLITTGNVKHAIESYEISAGKRHWRQPDITKWTHKTFNGFLRSDGNAGTVNYWIVVPMVFCENRNLDVLREALHDQLGYARPKKYKTFTENIIKLYREGGTVKEVLNADFAVDQKGSSRERLFENVDGVKFLSHTGGCGGTGQDAFSLCGLLAGYITHPNVAGATVLSLGCQHSQISILMDEIHKRSPKFDKPLYVIEQQKIGLEKDVLTEAIRTTIAGLIQANENKRQPVPLSKLCIGLECGGSDGFSGISANPAVGYTSDLLVALGCSVILSEFPELCGLEQEMSSRCIDENVAKHFLGLMKTYNDQAKSVGSGFDMNPSPGNIKDGLITDAIKSAGAARKGGTSPITDVLDYPEKVTRPGLNLLCTPGNDVESTTAEVGSGANIVLFTTGLGTPTGNPITPVIKVSSNTFLAKKMPDIIDINTGTIIDGEETIEQAGERILDYVIKVASGETVVAAVRHGQEDFIFWKRGVSL